MATVSAHNDSELGELVADAMEKVGSEGVVSVEEAKGTEISVEVVEGMQVDRGYLSPYFVTDAEKMQAILEEPVVLLYGKKITSIKDLVPLLEQVVKAGKPLLVIAEDVEGEALATLVVNKFAAFCLAQPSSLPAMAIDAKRSWKTSPYSQKASTWPRNWVSSLRPSRSTTWVVLSES